MISRKTVAAFVDAPLTQNLIIAVIIVNAVTLGLETSDTVMDAVGPILHALDKAALLVFVTEILLKLYARGLGFFKSGWNLFDFVIVGIALVPSAGSLSVLRALRILRALRLLSAVPAMRRVVQALLTAIPGIGSVGMLIMLIFYIGAVLTTNLYGETFPDWFGGIGPSMYTLFQVMTLESWSMGIVRPVMEAHPSAWIFFVPFILVTSFAVLNLFIGIIVDAMQSQHADEAEKETHEIHDDTKAIHAELKELRAEVRDLRDLLRLNAAE